MSRVLFVSRSTLFSQPGGDTLQMEQTAHFLRKMDIQVDIYTHGMVQERDYDILHFFNSNRPADHLPFLSWSVPKVMSAIHVDYSEYDKLHRGKMFGLLHHFIGSQGLEYLKVWGRMFRSKARSAPLTYLLRGHRYSLKKVLKACSAVLTASEYEYHLLKQDSGRDFTHHLVPLGSEHIKIPERKPSLRQGVVCAARIEGLKNQLQLIRALNGTDVHLKIIGQAAENQPDYYKQCVREADKNIEFTGPLKREELDQEFSKAKVHALASYYETTGLSTLEALRLGCQAVISNRGAQAEIFGKHVFYCDPDKPESIRQAVNEALANETDHSQWVIDNFSWARAAKKISDIYTSLL